MTAEDILNIAESYGLFTLILPFVLIFAVLYGILEKMNFFNKTVHASLSIIIALIATGLGYYSGCISSVIIAGIIALVSGIVLLILLGMLGPKKWLYNTIFGLIILIFIIAFFKLPGCEFTLSISEDLLIIIGTIIIIVSLIIFLMLPDNSSTLQSSQKETKQRIEKPSAEDSSPERKKKEEPEKRKEASEDLEELTDKDKKKIKELERQDRSGY